MNKQQYTSLRELQNAGVEATKGNSIRFNAGGTSETIPHIVGKTLAGKIALVNGYQIDTECVVPQGEIDVLLHSHPERLTYAVEIETNPTKDTIDSKLERYVTQLKPVDDIVVINANNIPMHMIEAADFIAQELGLEI